MASAPMVGVILAAGKGARMYPFSEQRPKPVLPILNRPLLGYQIDVMREAGITDIHIVVGHRGYQVASALGDGATLGVRIRYVEQETTLGLAHAVGALESRIDGPFVLMLGDIQFHLCGPLRPLMDEVSCGAVNANLVSREEPDPEMLRRNFAILADDAGRVRRVIEKPRFSTTRLKGCGLYVFDERIFDAIRRTPRTALRDEYEITDSIQIMIEDGWVVRHHPIVSRDLNLTRAEDLLMINLAELARRSLPRLVSPSAQLAPGTVVEHSVIGPDVIVRHPIRIVDSVIMPGAHVEARHDLTQVVTDGEHLVYCPDLDLQVTS
ncbi:glucose-1-phosphate thymidylyltransferase [Luteitalea sp. TBR-22]|uniref:sugar phosphate nucleotidyltransferase n=1 Tax=Luteitalea sp. TBR-22 TaxID=2802971 RepID=UPI001AFA5AB2|nr:sugar phosphate nucleotidyltransferase [Luteitalea sp. TBR-22]BCS33279.1 glucose-1-phosphate thymidylyltransferase [Luteitalea sp. TBR-22]